MALTYAKNQYTIPRGRVFFNPIVEALGVESYAGEIYLGNCPGFSISIETEKAEHYSSETGLREKDASVLLEVKRNGSLTCDNMSGDNVALFLSGSNAIKTQSAVSMAATEELDVIPGRYYQIGSTPQNPAGLRLLTEVSVIIKAGAALTAGTDYNLDAERGRIQILPSVAIDDGKTIEVSYKATANTWRQIKSGAAGELLGALRVISDNATGENRDFFMPRVSLLPSGELPVIAEGTDFAQMQFDADVLKPANSEAIYCDGLPVTT